MSTATEYFEQGLALAAHALVAEYGSEFITDLEEAIAAFSQALALEPGHEGALRERGRAFGKLGLHEEALESLLAAAALAPDDVDVRLALAQSLFAVGRREAALAAFELVLRLRPGHEVALRGKAEVLTPEKT